MNKNLLQKLIRNFISKTKKDPIEFNKDYKECLDLINYYQLFTKDKILSMNHENIYEYLSQLWAMLIWGNKHYVVDKIIEDNG